MPLHVAQHQFAKLAKGGFKPARPQACMRTTPAPLLLCGAGAVVIANAGICNRWLADDVGVPAQPCWITGSPALDQADAAAAALALEAGAFNQTCGFAKWTNGELDWPLCML